jgi:hypothetical protein
LLKNGLVNDFYHHDRFCHWRIYCLWHGHGNCRNTFILDKKMTAFEMADALSQYGEGAIFANIKMTDVATMLRFQAHEIEALLEQINELQRVL